MYPIVPDLESCCVNTGWMNEREFMVHFPSRKVISTILSTTKACNSVFFVARNSFGNLECIQVLFSLKSFYSWAACTLSLALNTIPLA